MGVAAGGLLSTACTVTNPGPEKAIEQNTNIPVVATPNNNSGDLQAIAPPGSFYDRVRRRKQAADQPAIEVAPTFQPAGEDSQVAVTMEKDGAVVESRIFRSHPKLARVQARWSATGEKTFNFYLRNGQTFVTRSSRIPKLRDASTRELLQVLETASAQPNVR
ncbi:MAG: hypothetical protein ABR530_03425 [Pyrinomonadaceae bacterium]